MRPFKEEGPPGRFDGPRDNFPGPIESDFYKKVATPETLCQTELGMMGQWID